MLARYKIFRGQRPVGDPQPVGIRQDTRKHTRHVLRPLASDVFRYLDDPSTKAWKLFEANYLSALRERCDADSTPFDALAALAMTDDVYLGCSCPTARNPDVARCHTVLALRFMAAEYPQLEVRLPSDGPGGEDA